MPARLRFFRPESRSKRIYLAHRHRHRLAIQLAALTQKCRLSVKIGFKQSAGAFTSVARENGGIHLYKALSLKVFVYRKNDGVTDAHDCPLTRTAQPQMALVHQKFNAMLFFGNRIVI